MLQLRNATPLQAEILVLPNCDGVDSLVVICKGTFELLEPSRFADPPIPIVLADEYRGDPIASSIGYPSEAHLPKLGIDVLVLGEAWAPGGRPVTELDLTLAIGATRVRARVYGERVWVEGYQGLRPSRAQPFTSMPIIYERAYGGRQLLDPATGTFSTEPRNPVGVGFLGHRGASELLGQPAPNIEDPSCLLTRLGQTPEPIGFGAIGPSWQPRVSYVGTYDDLWRQNRAPYLPTDFNPRYFQVAPPRLVFGQLAVGAPIVLDGFHPSGTLRAVLPSMTPTITVRIGGEDVRPNAPLETVILEPTQERLSLTWRAMVPAGKRILDIKEVAIHLNDYPSGSPR